VQCQEDSTTPQDVLDTAAWVLNWLASVGSYAGRQERPWRRPRDEPLDDLPKIYIPNELTGNEIVRALKLTGKEQMVVEENEFLNFLNFHVMRSEDFDDDSQNVTSVNGTDYYSHEEQPRYNDFSQFFEEDATSEHFILSKSFIEQAKDFLGHYPLSESTIGTVEELLKIVSLKKEQDTWDNMVEEANSLYQQMMSLLEEKNLAKKTEEGLYTITKSGSDLAFSVVNATVLEDMRRYRFRDIDQDYQEFKRYEDFMKQVDSMAGAVSATLHLPAELSWENIKLTLQTIYKKAIPQVHLFQFLTRRSLDYLDIETDVKGMSKLSDFVTQAFVNSMWGLFGYIHPLGQYQRERSPPPSPDCGGRIRLGNQATIRSPGYPSNYDSNLDCIWTITAPEGSMMKLEFLNFDLEPDSSCTYDYVSVHDGGSEFAERLGSKACGTSSGGPHISTSNTMTVKFHTDGSDTRQGFEARITKEV